MGVCFVCSNDAFVMDDVVMVVKMPEARMYKMYIVMPDMPDTATKKSAV